MDGISEITQCIELASDPSVSGVVLNRGMAQYMPPNLACGLILQTFGCPIGRRPSNGKVPIANITDALRLSADAIAVELDLNTEPLSTATRLAASAIGEASTNDIPALLMITPFQDGEPYNAIADAVRFGIELGADLIKIGISDALLGASSEQLAHIRRVVRSGPPVLLAGGAIHNSVNAKLALAVKLGFGGVCIGRNIFQNGAKTDFRSLLGRAFEESTDDGR